MVIVIMHLTMTTLKKLLEGSFFLLSGTALVKSAHTECISNSKSSLNSMMF